MAKNKRTPKGKIGDARKSADADWEVEKIVAVATGKDGNRCLVRWKGYAEKHDTTANSQGGVWVHQLQN